MHLDRAIKGTEIVQNELNSHLLFIYLIILFIENVLKCERPKQTQQLPKHRLIGSRKPVRILKNFKP